MFIRNSPKIVIAFFFYISRKVICVIYQVTPLVCRRPSLQNPKVILPFSTPSPSQTFKVRFLQSRGLWQRPTPWLRLIGHPLLKDCTTMWARGRAQHPRNLGVGFLKNDEQVNSFVYFSQCPWGVTKCS